MSEATSFGVSHTGLPDDNRALEPPDPIPNSDVKRCIADGSVAFRHVRVGHRQASNNEHPNRVSGWGVFFSGYVGMTYSLRVAERRPGHGDARHLCRAGLRPVGRADALNCLEQFSQASNKNALVRESRGFLLCAIKKCVPGLPMTNGHGDARHLWRAGLRPVGRADALTGAPARLSGQFSQASNNKHPNRVSGWGVFFSGYVGMTYSLRVAERRPGRKRPAKPSSQPD